MAEVYNAASLLFTQGIRERNNDQDGSALTGGGRASAWDSQNRLVTCAYSSNTSSYVYGADGIRRRSSVNGMTTFPNFPKFPRPLSGARSQKTQDEEPGT